jgi:hypothetical protein
MVENQRVARREELRYWKPKWLELVEVLTPLPKNYSRIVPTVCSIGIMTSQAVYLFFVEGALASLISSSLIRNTDVFLGHLAWAGRPCG